MPESMQRRLVMLFCLQCSDVLVTLQVTEIAFYLRISEQEMEETKKLFLAKGFIDDNWNLLNWSSRQFASDSSSERSKSYRERKRTSPERDASGDATSRERRCNVTATERDALDTDTDTDTEKNLNTHDHSAGVELVYQGYPRRVGKGKAIPAIEKAVVHLGKGIDLPAMTAPEACEFLHRRVQAFARSPAGQAGDYTPHPATWFHGKRYLDDDSEWNRGRNDGTAQQRNGTGNPVSPATQRVSNSRNAFAAAAERFRGSDAADAAGADGGSLSASGFERECGGLPLGLPTAGAAVLTG